MIKISLDECFVFDILSINEVKILKLKNKKDINKTKKTIFFLKKEICSQIGKELFEKIIHSKEYKLLLSANEKTFILVDRAKKDNGLAKSVDESNYQRYIYKQKLQKKFFKKETIEVKIGYK